jgi:hypothetical protein
MSPEFKVWLACTVMWGFIIGFALGRGLAS